MKNRIVTFAVLLVMITMGTWAQNLPGGIWTSPQSTATEGRYRSNADDFIRPDAYAGLKFDKWFGMVSFLNDSDNEAIATAGFATKASGIYIGAFYNGNFWANAPGNSYTEQQFAAGAVPNGGVAGKTYNTYPTVSVETRPVNNAAILIGVADMGFRITYRTNHQSFNKSDIVVGSQLYKNYHVENGYIAPQIAWSMAKDLTSNGIRPYITADLNFVRDNQKVETQGVDAAGNTGQNIGRSVNHFDPSLGLGLGGYTFYNKDGFKGSFDVDYVLALNIYNNEYSYLEGSSYKTATIKGTYAPGATNDYYERSEISNSLTPSLSGSWSKERLALKFKLNLPLTLNNTNSSAMGLNANKLVKEGPSNAITAFSFRPDLRLALQYKIVPDKLTLNTGARIQATELKLNNISRESYVNNSKTSSSTLHEKSFTGTFASRFSLGASFNFTENAWVEATTGVTNAFGDKGAIDIFAPGGLFSFGSILVALKF